MANASADSNFKDELTTTEQWFKLLSEPERTALVHTLLQHSTQEQMQFFSAVLQQMKTEDSNSDKPKSAKTGVRPPSLNIPLPDPHRTPASNSTFKAQDPAVPPINGRVLNLSVSANAPGLPLPRPDDALHNSGPEKNWASMVNTPVVPMLQKSDFASVGSKGPGLAAINTSTLNLLATSGLSNNAQLLAVQLVMSGNLQPAEFSSTFPNQEQTPSSRTSRKGRKSSHGYWGSPSSSKYPSSVLRRGPDVVYPRVAV